MGEIRTGGIPNFIASRGPKGGDQSAARPKVRQLLDALRRIANGTTRRGRGRGNPRA